MFLQFDITCAGLKQPLYRYIGPMVITQYDDRFDFSVLLSLLSSLTSSLVLGHYYSLPFLFFFFFSVIFATSSSIFIPLNIYLGIIVLPSYPFSLFYYPPFFSSFWFINLTISPSLLSHLVYSMLFSPLFRASLSSCISYSFITPCFFHLLPELFDSSFFVFHLPLQLCPPCPHPPTPPSRPPSDQHSWTIRCWFLFQRSLPHLT